MVGTEERCSKDLAHCYEMGMSKWGAVGSVVYLAPDHFCHLHLGFCMSMCLAQFMSLEGAMSILQGSSRNWHLVPSFQEAQGKELGGAAVGRAG